MKRWLLIFILFISTTALANTFTASVSRTQIAQGETFNLVLLANGDISGTPDLKPLEQNFQVLGSAKNTSISIINGSRSEKKQWTVTLTPKQTTGEVTIPAVHLGSLTSQPIKVDILSAQKLAALGKPQSVFIKTSVSSKKTVSTSPSYLYDKSV